MHWHQCLHFYQSYPSQARKRGVLTDFDGAQGDHGTITLVDSAIDLLKIIGVGDDLITGDNILNVSKVSHFPTIGSTCWRSLREYRGVEPTPSRRTELLTLKMIILAVD